jgi:mRNA-degrading endonuclease toxin of MazEF toxin-antitoxin module
MKPDQNMVLLAVPPAALAGAGTTTSGVVRCDQPRALNLAARAGRKLDSVPDAIMDELPARMEPIFE